MRAVKRGNNGAPGAATVSGIRYLHPVSVRRVENDRFCKSVRTDQRVTLQRGGSQAIDWSGLCHIHRHNRNQDAKDDLIVEYVIG